MLDVLKCGKFERYGVQNIRCFLFRYFLMVRWFQILSMASSFSCMQLIKVSPMTTTCKTGRLIAFFFPCQLNVDALRHYVWGFTKQRRCSLTAANLRAAFFWTIITKKQLVQARVNFPNTQTHTYTPVIFNFHLAGSGKGYSSLRVWHKGARPWRGSRDIEHEISIGHTDTITAHGLAVAKQSIALPASLKETKTKLTHYNFTYSELHWHIRYNSAYFTNTQHYNFAYFAYTYNFAYIYST